MPHLLTLLLIFHLIFSPFAQANVPAAWTAYDVAQTYKNEGGEASLKQLAIDGAISVVALGAGKVAYKVGGKLIESAPEAFAAVKNLGLWGESGAAATTTIVKDVIKDGGKLTGQNFGKLGTVVEKPNVQITGVAEHFVDRKIQRELTSSQVFDTLKNPTVVLKQSNGGYLFINDNAAVVVGSNGRLITTYGSKQFDSTIQSILRQTK